MSTAVPFSLRIFVADGDPDGLRLVERSNWTGKAVVFPRVIFPAIRGRDEFQQTGVYLLVGPRESGEGDQLYIGEGDPVKPRLEQHYAKKDFWTKAVFFVAGPSHLNKAHVQYLESRLIKQAATARRVVLDNGNTPTEPTLSEADRADMDVFLSHILGMLPVLGVHAFEQAAPKTQSGSPLLTCQAKGVLATGRDTAQGFVVYAGSQAVLEETPALLSKAANVVEVRARLRENGVIVEEAGKLQFTQDFVFTSPSFASTLVVSRPSNGRVLWKDQSGRTLKEIQEAQAARG